MDPVASVFDRMFFCCSTLDKMFFIGHSEWYIAVVVVVAVAVALLGLLLFRCCCVCDAPTYLNVTQSKITCDDKNEGKKHLLQCAWHAHVRTLISLGRTHRIKMTTKDFFVPTMKMNYDKWLFLYIFFLFSYCSFAIFALVLLVIIMFAVNSS